MSAKDKIKDFLAKKREEFNALIAPPVAPAAAAIPPPAAPPAPPVAPLPKTYKLLDGTEISVQQAGDTLAVGDTVMIGAAPVAAGPYTLEDGTVITCDAAGMVAGIVQPAAVTAPAAAATPPPVAAVPVAAATAVPAPVEAKKLPDTPDAMRALVASFAIGSTEDRIANLELVAKALMEYSFGWQIRESEQKATAEQAINIYREELRAVTEKMKKHEEFTKSLLDKFSAVVDEEPTEDPRTLTGNKKIQFDRTNARNERFQKMADAIKKNKEKVSA